jgi:glycosyltransferase involved in cell wall biosynthesis
MPERFASANPSTMAAPRIAVAIPCYRVKEQIIDVLDGIGPEVCRVYVVDDACPEGSGAFVESTTRDPRVRVLYHPQNQGVGGAMITAYTAALEESMDVVVKIDGDGQMDPRQLPAMVLPLLNGSCDYTKGNRFYTLTTLKPMPLTRLLGNTMLSFMAKISTGYWPHFDPNNGYTAIHTKVLRILPLEKVDRRFFFETDMLFRLNTVGAVVKDIPAPARYGDETSNLDIGHIIPEFLAKHTTNFIKRLFYNYYLRNFSIFSVQLLIGLGLILLGSAFGLYTWVSNATTGVLTTSGTVMLAALPILIGSQMVLSFFNYDILAVPHDPLHPKLPDPEGPTLEETLVSGEKSMASTDR